MAAVLFLTCITRTLGNGSPQDLVVGTVSPADVHTQTRSEMEPSLCTGLASLLLVLRPSLAFVAGQHLRKNAACSSTSCAYHLRSRAMSISLDGAGEVDGIADSERVLFDWTLSTVANYGTQQPVDFVESFLHIRRTRDYDFHYYYPDFRQRTQNTIIERFLGLDLPARVANPWIVFTAGAMGAGKSYVMHTLHRANLCNLEGRVYVDMDQIREMLPEYDHYVRDDQECLKDPQACLVETAGDLTQVESGYIQEILLEAALERGKQIVVDGSMHNAGWWKSQLKDIKQRYPEYRVAILEIVTAWEDVERNIEERYNKTGRMVPLHTVKISWNEVPEFVADLSESEDVDACYKLENVHGAPLPRLMDHSGAVLADLHEPLTSPAWQVFSDLFRGSDRG